MVGISVESGNGLSENARSEKTRGAGRTKALQSKLQAPETQMFPILLLQSMYRKSTILNQEHLGRDSPNLKPASLIIYAIVQLNIKSSLLIKWRHYRKDTEP